MCSIRAEQALRAFEAINRHFHISLPCLLHLSRKNVRSNRCEACFLRYLCCGKKKSLASEQSHSKKEFVSLIISLQVGYLMAGKRISPFVSFRTAAFRPRYCFRRALNKACLGLFSVLASRYDVLYRVVVSALAGVKGIVRTLHAVYTNRLTWKSKRPFPLSSSWLNHSDASDKHVIFYAMTNQSC